jgi:hypothetical protein
MRLIKKERESGNTAYGIIYGAIALCAIGAARYLPVLDLLPACAFRGLTGIPCPACGSTRSLVHLAHGDILSAALMNPCLVLLMLAAFAWFAADAAVLLLRLRTPSLRFTPFEGTMLRILAVLFFLANWAFLIFRFSRS